MTNLKTPNHQINMATGDTGSNNLDTVGTKTTETKSKKNTDLLALYDSTIARLYNSKKVSERFVGREEELNKLNLWAEKSLQGQGKPVFIIGDPGIGKTELVKQFFSASNVSELEEQHQINLLTGHYFDVGANDPYKVFMDAFYRTISSLENKFSSEDAAEKIKTLSNQLQELKELSSNIFLQDSERERAKYKTFELLTQNYILLCSIFPVILFLDDLQWADELGLEFLAYLIRAMQEKPFFLICTVRERELLVENHPLRTWMRSMSRYNSYEQIKLRPFSEEETESLMDHIFSYHNFEESVIKKLHKETGGNPYYLIEIIRQLIEDEKIHWEGEVWQIETLEEVHLPNSLVDLVELQLSRISESALQIFQQAAVVGEDFSFELLQLLTQTSEKELVSFIGEGLKQFLIREEAPSLSSSSEKYAFRYNTTRKVLYEKLSTRERKMLHSKLARILEERKIDVRDFDESSVAYHYLHSGEVLKAFQWSTRAAMAACNKFAFDKAKEFFDWASKALNILESSNRVADDVDLGNYYCAYGQYKTSIAEYEEAIRLLKLAQATFQKTNNKEKEIEVLISLGNCLKIVPALGEALEALIQALDMANKLKLLKLVWLAAYGAAQCEKELGHIELAKKLLKEASTALVILLEKSSELEKEQLESANKEIKSLIEELQEKTDKRPTFEQKKLDSPEVEKTAVDEGKATLDASDKVYRIEVIASPLEIFKNSALEFKNLHNTNTILNKLSRSQPEPPRVVGLIFSQLKQLKTKIQTFDPLTANTQLAIINTYLNEYRIWLKKINDTLPPYTLRQYLEQGILIQEEMFQLTKFLIGVGSEGNDDKIKAEILLGRALEIEVERHHIITGLFPSDYVFSLLSWEEPTLKALKDVLSEWDKVETYSQAIESNLMMRIKQAKSKLGNVFWHPEVLTMIVEQNLKQGFKVAELIEKEQKEVGLICEQLIKVGVKTLPRQGQTGALDLEAARRTVERARELISNNHENNRSGMMMLAEIGRLLRAYLKEQSIKTESKNASTQPQKIETVTLPKPIELNVHSNVSDSPKPNISAVNPKENPKFVASPVFSMEPRFMASPVPKSEQGSEFQPRPLIVDVSNENEMRKTFSGSNPYEVILQNRLAEICILLATKLRDVPVKVLQLKNSQLTLASWEVEALLTENESNPELRRQNSLIRRSIALLAEMQEVGVSFKELASSGKTTGEALDKASYFLDKAKIVTNDLEMESHAERNKEQYSKAQNLAATRQKLISTHQLLSSIISWLKRETK